MLTVLEPGPPDGWDVVAVAPPDGPLSDELKRIGIGVVPFDLRADGNRPPPDWAAAMLDTVLTEVDADIAHANSLSMGRLTGRLARTTGRVFTTHIRDAMKLSTAALRDVNSNAAIVCVSHATREYHLAGGLDADRARVVWNGVRASAGTKPGGWLSRELGVAESVPLIATVGQICLRKGHDVAASALSKLGDLDWRWLIIGERFSQKTESVDFDRSIETVLNRAGLDDRIVRLGYRHDMADVYGELDVLLHAARQEPLGRVLLEAGAYGVPVVATDAGGTREIVGDKFRLATVDDDAAIAELTRGVLADPASGRFDVERFSVEASTESCWKIWNDMIATDA